MKRELFTVPQKEGKVRHFTCSSCGKSIPITFNEEEIKGLQNYLSDKSKLIQEELPTLHRSDRELIKAGICDDCFKAMFGPMELPYDLSLKVKSEETELTKMERIYPYLVDISSIKKTCDCDYAAVHLLDDVIYWVFLQSNKDEDEVSFETPSVYEKDREVFAFNLTQLRKIVEENPQHFQELVTLADLVEAFTTPFLWNEPDLFSVRCMTYERLFYD